MPQHTGAAGGGTRCDVGNSCLEVGRSVVAGWCSGVQQSRGGSLLVDDLQLSEASVGEVVHEFCTTT